ncbi:MAG TPA: hypothetical protein VKJ65_08030, partial [Phycisphaerae bacterium]|nr:hypothetical protein [Phycisphaerae bacterium]
AVVAFFRVFHWRAAGALALVALVVVLISAPFYLRNIHQFGSPLGPVNSPDPHNQFINAVITPKSILTNLLRNTGPMFAGPIDQVNQAVDWIISGIASKCSLNLQDPRLTFSGPIGSTSYDGAHYFPGNENRITWPFQMFLLLITPIGLWLMRKEPLNAARWWWLALPAGILLIFSALLRWHPAEAHLLLAIPVLLAPLAALAVAAFRPAFLRGILAVGAAAWLLPPLLLFPRPLLGPQGVEFHSRVYELNTANHLQTQSMDELADKLSGFPPRPGGLLIGLYLPGSLPFAYSIQAPLLDALHPVPRFTYFNATVQVPGRPEPDPDLIIAPEKFSTLEHFSTGTKFKLSQTAGLLYLYVPLAPSAH